MKHNKRLFSFLLALVMIFSLFPSTSYAASKDKVTPRYSNISIEVGAKSTLTVKKAKNVKIKKISYSSTNKKVVTVTSKGSIKGKKVGKATIKAKVTYYYKNKTYNKTVKTKVSVKACSHKNYGSWKIITKATCSTTGKKSAKCKQCGKTIYKTISKLDHKYNSGVVTKAATCTEEGIKTFTCTLCKDTVNVPIEKLSHTWDNGKITTKPTCKDIGKKTYTCTVCKTTRVEDVPITNNHIWKTTYTVDKQPTETEAGKKSVHCSVCDTIKPNSTVAIPKLECTHTYDDGKITTEPTCTEDGIKTYTCTKCNSTKTEVIPSTGHTIKTIIEKKPTYEEVGIEKDICEVCETVLETREIPINSCNQHEYEETSRIASTCNTAGSITETCTICNSKKITPLELDPNNHEGESIKTVVVEPTCISYGIEKEECSVCSALIKSNILNPTEHIYSEEFTIDEEATCMEEGSKSRHCTNPNCSSVTDVTPIEISDHVPIEVDYIEPTCIYGGKEADLICKYCEELIEEGESIPALGHDFTSNPVYIQYPTCTEKGYTAIYCSRPECNECSNITEVSATGHDWISLNNAIDPTCTEDGKESDKICLNCELIEPGNTIPSLGQDSHTLDEGTITKEATCTEAGQHIYTCTREGCTYTEIKDDIPATGHIWDDTECTICHIPKSSD